MNASLYPLFLNLRDRTCVVVGGSAMAEGKTRELLDSGARIRLVAPTATNQIFAWAQVGKLQWETRAYQTGDLEDAFLVVSVADAETNARVFAEAEMRHIFCNAVDDIPHCSCYAPAVMRRGPLQIAVSTAGNSPALAQRLRTEFEEQFGEEYGVWVQQLGESRSLLFQDKSITNETRRKMLHELASKAAFETFRNSHQREGASYKSVNIAEGGGKSS
jgi:precorrin-2 dehydrogenase / sirohydrochlorin ferrochelatase